MVGWSQHGSNKAVAYIINPNPGHFNFFKTAKYQGCLGKPFRYVLLDGNTVRIKESTTE